MYRKHNANLIYNYLESVKLHQLLRSSSYILYTLCAAIPPSFSPTLPPPLPPSPLPRPHERQLADEAVDVGHLRHLDDVIERHVSRVIAVRDVLGDRPVEEDGLLGDDADLSPRPGEVQVGDVTAV